jgi:hypothetical protein
MYAVSRTSGHHLTSLCADAVTAATLVEGAADSQALAAELPAKQIETRTCRGCLKKGATRQTQPSDPADELPPSPLTTTHDDDAVEDDVPHAI